MQVWSMCHGLYATHDMHMYVTIYDNHIDVPLHARLSTCIAGQTCTTRRLHELASISNNNTSHDHPVFQRIVKTAEPSCNLLRI